jgi:hypothetical protein
MFLSCGLVQGAGQQSSGQQRASSTTGKVAGVITRVEPSQSGARRPGQAWKVTIKTDAVWRDFVRDQAVAPTKAARTGIAKAASKGRESVATEGQPQAKQTLIAVDLNPQTDITMRYRSSTDAIGEGSATPEGAGRAETASDKASGRESSATPEERGSRRQALKARRLEMSELRPGLWVEVNFEHQGQQNQARRVIVMRPVGGPDTSPDKEKPDLSGGNRNDR